MCTCLSVTTYDRQSVWNDANSIQLSFFIYFTQGSDDQKADKIWQYWLTSMFQLISSNSFNICVIHVCDYFLSISGQDSFGRQF